MDITRFDLLNPWRVGRKWSSPWVPRECTRELQSWIDEPEVLVVLGARQVGKTSIVLQLVDWLLHVRKVPPEDIFFFNLDQSGFSEFLVDQAAVLQFLKATGDRVRYLFIDEVQRLERPGLLVKGLHDLGLPLKIVLTGSSSLDIRAKTGEPLTGRKQVFRVAPFTFREFVDASGFACPDAGEPRGAWNPYLPDLKRLVEEYVTWGGYPAVVLSGETDKKLRRLDEIFSSYLDKDVAGFLGVRNLSAFRRLVVLLGAQQGGSVNVQELSSTLGISHETVNTYIDHLEQTFVLARVTPWSTNPRTELSRMPKLYFADSGLRRQALGLHSPGLSLPDAGPAVEGVVAAELAHRLTPGTRLHYWRTKAGAEVDFVTGALFPNEAWEVKSAHMVSPRLTRSMRSFLAKYHPGRACVLNMSLWTDVNVGEARVEFLPLSVFLLRRARAAEGTLSS